MRTVASRQVTSRVRWAGSPSPNRSASNRLRAVDCIRNVGPTSRTSSATASRQLPWCGSSMTSTHIGASPAAAPERIRPRSVAAGSVSISPVISMLVPDSCVMCSTSEKSLSRVVRNPRLGHITRTSSAPIRSESPADTLRSGTPRCATPARKASTAGMRFALATNESCTTTSPTSQNRTMSSRPLK